MNLQLTTSNPTRPCLMAVLAICCAATSHSCEEDSWTSMMLALGVLQSKKTVRTQTISASLWLARITARALKDLGGSCFRLISVSEVYCFNCSIDGLGRSFSRLGQIFDC